jgi:N-acetylglucosaminyldiphosphoundecaprenol N-acetyl-beta-D-mannosaminyltransferase
MPERIYIDRCPIDCITMLGTVERLQEAIDCGQRLQVTPVNAATVVNAARVSSFPDALNEMDVLLPDGYWVQVAARLLRCPTTNHVATVPLTYRLLQRLASHGGRVYLLGAKDFVVLQAANEIDRRFPGIEIVGIRNGYFSETEEQDVVNGVNEAKPDLLLIGISSPKKELFMARHRERLNVPVVIGVGGLIDILGGKTAEGPDWLRNYGLMWLYRLAKEPRRLFRRYTITNFQFALLVLKQAMKSFFNTHR